MDKYARIQGLIFRLDFTAHVLEEAHVFQRYLALKISGFLNTVLLYRERFARVGMFIFFIGLLHVCRVT